MKKKHKAQIIRGFVFVCTQKTEEECFERFLFGANKAYSPIVFRIRKGDLLFLRNLDTDFLYGVFGAVTNGEKNIQPDAWNRRYPYQVQVKTLGEKIGIRNSKKILDRLRIKRNTPIFGKKLIDFLNAFASEPNLFNLRGFRTVDSLKRRIKERVNEVDIDK